MGLLDQLWDDTVAGPRPDTGLGRLRKHSSFPFRSIAVKGEGADAGIGRSDVDEAPKVTRSIMIKRPAGCPSSPAGSTPPSSPAGSTPPLSPFAGVGRLRRKSSSDAYERGALGPKTPTPPPFEV